MIFLYENCRSLATNGCSSDHAATINFRVDLSIILRLIPAATLESIRSVCGDNITTFAFGSGHVSLTAVKKPSSER
jgi:hypothetical protein